MSQQQPQQQQQEATSQQFCVRWNSHLPSLGASVTQLLMDDELLDATIYCEGHGIRCHRMVLASCSPLFHKVLVHARSPEPSIILANSIKAWQIEALLQFMYKGEVNVSPEGLQELVAAAEQLEIRGLCNREENSPLPNIVAMSQQQQTPPQPSSQTQTTATTATATTTPSPLLELITDSEGAALIGDDATAAVGAGATLTPSARISTSTPLSNGNDNTQSSSSLSGSGHFGGAQIKMEMPSISEPEISSEPVVAMDESELRSEEEFPLNNVICEYEHGGDMPMASGGGGGSGHGRSVDNSSHGRRVRRSEAQLQKAAECVARGQTFQTVSEMSNIPISTIRFFMARRGILPRRKRGRTAQYRRNATGGGAGIDDLNLSQTDKLATSPNRAYMPDNESPPNSMHAIKQQRRTTTTSTTASISAFGGHHRHASAPADMVAVAAGLCDSPRFVHTTRALDGRKTTASSALLQTPKSSHSGFGASGASKQNHYSVEMTSAGSRASSRSATTIHGVIGGSSASSAGTSLHAAKSHLDIRQSRGGSGGGSGSELMSSMFGLEAKND